MTAIGFFSLSFSPTNLIRLRLHVSSLRALHYLIVIQMSDIFPCLFSPGLSSPYHHTNDSHTPWHSSTPVDLTHSLYISDINLTMGSRRCSSSQSLIFLLFPHLCFYPRCDSYEWPFLMLGIMPFCFVLYDTHLVCVSI